MKQLELEFIPTEDFIAARRSLLHYWIKLGVSMQDAEDLVQAGMLKSLQNLEKFRGEANLKTWLIAVGKNEGYTYLRKQARQGRIKQRLFGVIQTITTRRQSSRRKRVPPVE